MKCLHHSHFQKIYLVYREEGIFQQNVQKCIWAKIRWSFTHKIVVNAERETTIHTKTSGSRLNDDGLTFG